MRVITCQRLIMLIALTKNQLGTLMEIWSMVSGCARIALLSSATFHQGWKCAWGMLRQPCLNYSLTLWPVSCIDTTVPTGTIGPGRNRLHLCARLLQDHVSRWNLNCGACAGGVSVFRASPLNCGGAQSCWAQGFTWNPPPPPPPHLRWSPVSGLETSSCKWTAYSNTGAGLMPFNSLGRLVLSGSL